MRESRLFAGKADVRPVLMKRLHDALEGVMAFLETGFDEPVFHSVAHEAASMLCMLRGDDDVEETAEDSLVDSLSSFISDTVFDGEISEDAVAAVLEEDEELLEDGSVWVMSSLLREKSLSLWQKAEEMTETLWVGGLLYGEAFQDMMVSVMSACGDTAHILGMLRPSVPPFALDYSPYFEKKYGVYFRVYEKAGWGSAFALQGQKLMTGLALELIKREEFFDRFLSLYDSGEMVDMGEALASFPGSDRRVEILRQLSREKEMTYGSFSTFDPSPLMKALVEDIRADYWGGTYTPLGENDAYYECIVPQLRRRWQENHK